MPSWALRLSRVDIPQQKGRGRLRKTHVVRCSAEGSPGLKVYRSTWGFSDLTDPSTMSEALAETAAQGYAGIEAALDFTPHPQGLAEAASDAGLELIMQVHTCGYPHITGQVGSRNVEDHVRSFGEKVSVCKDLGVALVNSHSGHDSWSLEEGVRYLDRALEIEASAGVTVCHETHRRRLMWNPWSARDLLKRMEGTPLKINCDLSHWVVVCERLFDADAGDDDWPEILQLAADHAVLIHARVGYEEGPQVPDPSAPEYAAALEMHEAWWDTIIASMIDRGVQPRLEPEFGPPPYLHTTPHDQEPVGDLAAVNHFVAVCQEQRFCRTWGSSSRLISHQAASS